MNIVINIKYLIFLLLNLLYFSFCANKQIIKEVNIYLVDTENVYSIYEKRKYNKQQELIEISKYNTVTGKEIFRKEIYFLDNGDNIKKILLYRYGRLESQKINIYDNNCRLIQSTHIRNNNITANHTNFYNDTVILFSVKENFYYFNNNKTITYFNQNDKLIDSIIYIKNNTVHTKIIYLRNNLDTTIINSYDIIRDSDKLIQSCFLIYNSDKKLIKREYIKGNDSFGQEKYIYADVPNKKITKAYSFDNILLAEKSILMNESHDTLEIKEISGNYFKKIIFKYSKTRQIIQEQIYYSEDSCFRNLIYKYKYY